MSKSAMAAPSYFKTDATVYIDRLSRSTSLHPLPH